MADISLDLRRRIVRAYRAGLTASYEATAELFGVGRASVSRLLRRDRETGDVLPKKRGGDRRRSVDLAWLEEQAQTLPDARLVDRIEAWEQRSGRQVSIGAMWNALDAIGWTHKKRRRSRSNATGPRSRPSARRSSPNNHVSRWGG
jgi:putative transposase